MYRDLHEFVGALERSGELLTVSESVDAVLEVAEITDRVSKSAAPSAPSAAARKNDPRFSDRGGPALLFNNIEGAAFPLLINAFGSYRRTEMALGCDRSGFDSIADRIAGFVKPQPPRSFRDALAKARQFAPLLKIGPKRRRGPGPCQQVVRTGDKIDLTLLPLIRCWPHDGDPASLGYPEGINDAVEGLGHPDKTHDEWDAECRGRYITFAGIHTIHADDAGQPKPSTHNIGMYRLQLLGKDRLAMHWHMHHDGARHWRSWKERGEPMPVAIAFGGESVLPYAATAPLPPGISELLMAGFLHGRGIEMTRARTVPLWVPANAEIVIEGFVRTDA
ncbi:MAG: UbiD family decarboxylase, partial [Phycisphaerales bacterium]|nr:UbiD family decarboxylase [Phycisphaerales bacterium]